MLKKALTLLSILLCTLPALAEEEIPKVLVENSFESFMKEGKVIYALSYKNHPHWHTYWKNPGDAGLVTSIEPTTEGVSIEEFEWPVPTRYIEEGDILAYGYSDEYTRYFSLNPAKGDKLPSEIKITSKWLVCKHVCIPGKIDIVAKLDPQGQVISSNAKDFKLSNEEVLKRFNALPQAALWPEDLDIVLKKGKDELGLNFYYNYSNKGSKKLFHNLGLLTPFPHTLLDIKREKLHRNNAGKYFAQMTMLWDGEYAEPEVELPKDGVFLEPIKMKFLFQDPRTETIKVIEKEFKTIDMTPGDTIESLMKTMSFVAPKKIDHSDDNNGSGEGNGDHENEGVATGGDQAPSSFLGILFFAFIGGLILNVMPCVLPVISLKLFGLVSHSDETRASILRHNIFYTLGVLATFLALALSILALKATGENVGWGFQLQSPVFVAIMIILLFGFSLNLFGLFEFMTPGGRTLGDVQLKKGVVGDFFGGVLATILSTPCSAPFLGTALTFAFSSSPFLIILIFQAIGLGLAFPFLMTGLFPATVKFLPRPGMWMNHVKKFLGLTLILTSLWLVDVFVSLTNGNTPLLYLLSGLIFLFFAFYYQQHISKKVGWRMLFWAFPVLLFAQLFFTNMIGSSAPNQAIGADLLNEKNAHGKLSWEPWTEDKMKEYQNQGQVVFIDFTAKWCFTCKVNEKLVIDTSSFKKLVDDNGIKLMLGDWTKYDPVIGDFLKKNGHVGVPAYFLIKADGSFVKLGETISISEIQGYL